MSATEGYDAAPVSSAEGAPLARAVGDRSTNTS